MPASAPAALRRLPRRPALAAALVLASALAACNYQPRLLGGADPGDATVRDDAHVVVYSADCQGACEVSWSRAGGDVGVREVEGSWQERVRMPADTPMTVILTVRPVDENALVRRAGIDVNGRRAARGEGGRNTTVELSAPLVPRRVAG